MSLTYSEYVIRLASLMKVIDTDFDITTVLPTIIDNAEQRIYREMDLLSTVVANSSGTFTAGSRTFVLPTNSGVFIVVREVNCITPVSTAPASGTRNPLTPVSTKLLNFAVPVEAPTGVSIPSVFAMLDNATILVGPSPDAAYGVEVLGTIRPAPLSSSNPTTFLTTYLPDLFLAASMTIAVDYKPELLPQAPAWEQEYKLLFASADGEEMRKKYNKMLSYPPNTEQLPL